MTDLLEVVVEADVEFEAVVRPGAELEPTRLNVERKVGDVDLARRHEDCWRNPQNRSVMLDHTHRLTALS